MAGVEHQPGRPSWDCDTCGKPWPCDPARERLVVEGRGPSLAIMMWAYLEEAALELPTMPPAEFFDRFLAWTRPATTALDGLEQAVATRKRTETIVVLPD